MIYSTLQISQLTDSKLIGNPDILISNISFDSRNLYSISDTAFIAINTKNNSGEKYISSVVEKGVKVIISENYYPEYKDITWIITKNSIEFLQVLAKKHLENSHLENTIGITGSNGKTIVKEWLYQCLWDEFSTVKSPKSFNSQIGLPISLLQINSSNFKNEEELINEKIILFKESETIIYNGDNELVYNLVNQLYSSKNLISFGLNQRNDVRISSDYKNPNGRIGIKYFDEEISISLQKRDEATLSNILAIVAVLKSLKISNEKIVTKIQDLHSVEMRLESVNGIRNNLIINDSFNLDLDSLIIAYQFINQYQKQKKSLILTDILDTIEEDEILYKKVAELTNEQDFENIILIGEHITKYKDWFSGKVKIFDNTQELIDSQYLNTIENQLILLKGARVFEIEKIKKLLELQKHDTTLEVNLNAIVHNINIHKSLLKPETKVCAMVKAFSYGLGGYEIAEFLQHHHIDYLGVAYADEGVDLRKNGVTTPILVMNPEQSSYDTIIDYHLEPEIYSLRVLDLFGKQLQAKGIQETYPIHIKIETGMHRLGFKEDEIDDLIKTLKKYNVKIASIFSHLSCADVPEEKEYTLQQLETFERVSSKIIQNIDYKPIRHILNTAGIINFTDYQYDMVRIGIGMMGISCAAEIEKQLQNVATFKTVISQISKVEKGDSIGYSRKYIAEKDTRIATIPIGYADGIPRLIGNKKGFVIIKGQKVPIVGNVCMDMLMADLGEIPAKEGDEVVIFNSCKTLEEFADYCQTIPYEVLTSISRRVKRIYIKD